MQFNRICLVHYHEIGLKGKNRSYFEKQLSNNIDLILKSNNVSGYTIKRISGRILINLNNYKENESVDNIVNIISKIPGCARISSGYKCEQDVNTMVECGSKVLREAKNIESFKVSARRNHTNFKLDSMEINKIVGGLISDNFPDVKVQMKDPSIDIKIEVIEAYVYIYAESKVGIGGLPVGTGGKCVAMLSSGIDSPVSLWTLARRGASIIAVHFSGSPIVTSESEYLVKEICDKFRESGIVSKLYIIKIGNYQKMIAQDCQEKLRIILYRRFMYKIAEQVAKLEGAKAIITGESLGQVASQTVDNLSVTNAAVDMQVFRPLIGYDKQEIVDRAQNIETYDISIQKAPDCCTLYMPKSPETHAKLKYVLYAEQNFDEKKWIVEAINNSEIIQYNL